MRRVLIPLFVLAWAHAATAEPIRIVAGSIVYGGGGQTSPVTLIGDSEGFTLQGVAPNHLALGPVNQCAEPECLAGVSVSLDTSITDVLGQATFRGETYPVNPIAAPGTSEAVLMFDGAIVIPEDFTGGTLTAPFTFSGLYRYPGPPNNSLHLAPPLIGQGTATLTLSPWMAPEFADAFVVTSFRFDFTDAEPVPEPASMVLIGSGLGCAAVLRRRRRNSRLS